MSAQILSLFQKERVRAAFGQAWQDSEPAEFGGHEEGGFVLRDADGNLSVSRWQAGEQAAIRLPPHRECRIGELDIVVSFHTHPNTGSDYLQEPSETDRRAVRDDPDLKGKFYQGELVIAHEYIYHIEPNGLVSEIGETRELLGNA